MKRTLLLAIALLMCGIAVSQEKEKGKKFTLSIQENLLPFGDAGYSIDMYDDENRVPCKLYLLNWLHTFELDYDNKFSARLRFNVLYADEGVGLFDPFVMHFEEPYKVNYFNHDIATSTSVTLGYNFLNKSKAHRLKASAIFGAVYTYKDYYYGYEYADPMNHSDKETYLLPTERSWHFQIGAELSYQYFLPCTNYRLGFGASYELSYSNYNPQQTIGLFNLNISWKLFNF
ncbi:MAG: hypothetical protein J6V35_07225 [Bacteroidales bacterium]|nr:hypothetical protein [Bacteroidales bacterium]